MSIHDIDFNQLSWALNKLWMIILQRNYKDWYKKQLPQFLGFCGGNGENTEEIETIHSRTLAKSQNSRTERKVTKQRSILLHVYILNQIKIFLIWWMSFGTFKCIVLISYITVWNIRTLWNTI